MQTITKLANLPTPEAEIIGEQIEELEFKFRFFPDLAIPDYTRRVQVRNIKETAPIMEVNKYATAWQRGDKLPPVVVTQDGYVVDGATRIGGAIKAKKNAIAAFVVQANWDGAPDLVKKRLKTLGFALNMTHGRSMKADNIEALILDVAEEGITAAALARRLHCPESTVQGVLAGSRGRERAKRLGIAGSEAIGTSHMKTLGGKTALKDPTWKALVELARDATLTVQEIADISTALRDCTTETAELELIAGERTSRRDQIRRITTRPGLPGMMRRGVTQILKAEGNEESAVEWDPAAGELQLAQFLRVQGVLDKLITEQRSVLRNTVASPQFNPGK